MNEARNKLALLRRILGATTQHDALELASDIVDERASLEQERDAWRRKYKELVERNHSAELKALAERENQG